MDGYKATDFGYKATEHQLLHKQKIQSAHHASSAYFVLYYFLYKILKLDQLSNLQYKELHNFLISPLSKIKILLDVLKSRNLNFFLQFTFPKRSIFIDIMNQLVLKQFGN